MAAPRDFSDPRYKRWRRAVYRRDGYRCKMPGCPGGCRLLEAHHIRRWSDVPELRFAVGNGITLCKVCHERVTGVEKEWEVPFLRLVEMKDAPDVKIRMMMLRYGGADGE